MSLKEITKEVHQAAEETHFMKSVFKKQMTTEVWCDYTYNKMLWYGAIECKARAEGLLNDLPGIERAYYLYQDFKDLKGDRDYPKFTPGAIEYHRYILDLEPGKVLAHLYTWHMGDLFGGQMIKKMLPEASSSDGPSSGQKDFMSIKQSSQWFFSLCNIVEPLLRYC